MVSRPAELEVLLHHMGEVIQSSALDPEIRKAAADAFMALRTPAKRGLGHQPSRLAACGHLAEALAKARTGPEAIGEIAQAFAVLEPSLAWSRRQGSAAAGAPFHDGHANALVIGPKGLEERSDIWLGVSLMAPDVQYPLHRHPPEEIYVVLSPGEWKKGDAAWYEPGIGGVVHNPSGTTHSMRSASAPLLAFWLLWSDRDVSL